MCQRLSWTFFSFNFSREGSGLRWCRFDSSTALLVFSKPLLVLRGLVYLTCWWGVMCVAPHITCSRAKAQRRKESVLCKWVVKNMIRDWLYILSCCCFSVKAHWETLVSEITAEDTVMLQPPGIYHNNTLCGFVREIKTQRKPLCIKIWLSN